MNKTKYALFLSTLVLVTESVIACNDDECYSPSQNYHNAYNDGAVGCACSDENEPVCIEGVALVCSDGYWDAVIDGPCMPLPSERECYSPFQNYHSAYDDETEGCACSDENESVCIEGAALVCSNGYWQSVEDGPCMPFPDDECSDTFDDLRDCLSEYNTCIVEQDNSVCARDAK